MKKYAAEFIGTMILVLIGCGTAMLVGCDPSGSGYLLTALAFGLTIVAMAYSIGNISGCHINPAVSLAAYLTGQIDSTDLIGYIIAQVLGAMTGSYLLLVIFSLGGVEDITRALGANSLAGVHGSVWAGLIVEIILTFIFVLAVLGSTSSKHNHNLLSGLVIGGTLTLVHILGIGLTGTSVNPARSFGPAFMNIFVANYAPARELWVFIIAPLIGAILAALVYTTLEKEKSVVKKRKRIPKEMLVRKTDEIPKE